jgi:hypothetical protein
MAILMNTVNEDELLYICWLAGFIEFYYIIKGIIFKNLNIFM